MRKLLVFILIFFAISGGIVRAQSNYVINAPPQKRISLLWQYCSNNYISDQDSIEVYRFLNEVIRKAWRQGDDPLRAYALYFKQCWRILLKDHLPAAMLS